MGIPILASAKTSEDLITKLSAADSLHLQRATSEALAFLGYVKHFTSSEGSDEQSED